MRVMSNLPNISEVEVQPIKPQNGLIAFASCVVNDNWYIGSIAVYTRPEGGHRLVYPTKKVDGENISIIHPINKEVGEKVEKRINEKVQKLWDRKTKK
jgi:stage V sporulation protein G